MHIDARTLDDHSTIEGDICIIGAGAAGISLALEWILYPYRVILLEGGGFEYEDRLQDQYRGRTTGQPYYPLESARLHYFGGTTGHWGGMCSIFDPIAFQKRDWISGSGWPVDQQEMMPFYQRAHHNLDLGNCDFNLANWQKKDPALVALPLDRRFFWSKIWRYSPPTRFGEKYREIIVKSENIHLYTYANAVEIKTTENLSSVSEVIIRNHAGKTHKVVAKHFVMACCSIQNARLLLASNKQAPKGLGNGFDLVGRYFMEHAEVNSGELWLKEKSTLKLYMLQPPRVKAEIAMTAQKQAEYRIANGIVSLVPLVRGRKIPPLISTWSTGDPRENIKQISAAYENAKESRLSRFLNAKMYNSFQLVTRLEQVPNPESRVKLDTETDELGMPRVTLHWKFTPLEKRSLRKIFEVLGQQVGIAGIGRVRLLECLRDEKDESMPDNTSGGWHHMGTTRMSTDPRQGVVDANCKVHGISNLYIASSSCFPNGGAVNPTLTIVALSIRLSDHLKRVAGVV
jgi:choline dehydrogenase-like flavoprotein